MEIFSYLRPSNSDHPVHRRNLLRVALVCRFFCSVMLPWIFECMEFSGKSSNGSRVLGNYAPFCRSILHGRGSARTMASYVKRCAFSDWIDILDQNPSPSSWYTEFQTLYSRALAFMPNVEELVLTDVGINRPLLKSIMKLKCLTSLSLEYSFIGQAKGRDIRILSHLRLKHLRFFPLSPFYLGMFVTDDSCAISGLFCLDSLLTLHTSYWPLVERIAEQKCDLPLQDLEILDSDDSYTPDLLPEIFKKMPALKRLRIFSETSQYDVHFDNLLPALDGLRCPLSLLRSLVPGRPISNIDITTSLLTEVFDIPPLLKKSTAKIHTLSVPTHVYQMNPFWEHFPNLKSLRLHCAPDYLRSFCSFNELSLKLVFANLFFCVIECELKCTCIVSFIYQ